MEADWEVEIGPGAAVIDAAWSGSIDLVREPSRIVEIVEAKSFPPLADALTVLNAQLEETTVPPIRTLKCDLWYAHDLDPDEMDAVVCEAGLACYIDVLPRPPEQFFSLADAEKWVRRVVPFMRDVPCPSSRVDLVLRQAANSHAAGYGITAYLSGCGATLEHARESLGNALQVFATTVTTR